MASAPRPGGAGTSGGDDKVKAAAKTISITLNAPGKEPITRSFRPGAVPFSERLVVRKATGLPYESFMTGGEEAIGLDTIQVWWWIASRGLNPLCTLDQALADWPEDIDEHTFDVVTDDGQDDDDPEA